MPHDPDTHQNRVARWELLAVVVWVGFFVGISARLLINPHKGTVYPIFATAARHWLAGEGLYGPVPGHDVYRYSPLVAAGLTPLGLLPDRAGNIIWRFLNAAVFLSAFAWWGRTVLPLPLTRGRRAALFLLAVPLAVGNLNNGQSNMLVIGLLLAASAAFTEARWNVSAGCVAVACLFKVYPIAIGLLLAMLAPRRFLPRLAGALAAGLALPFVMQDPAYVAQQYAAWWHHMMTDDRQVLTLSLWYRDLRLLCAVYLVPLSPVVYECIQLVVAAGTAALCLAGYRAGWAPRQLLTTLLALGCCWMTVFGPVAESSTYILLAPSLSAALVIDWDKGGGWRRGLLWASAVVFLISQGSVWFPGGARLRNLGPHPLAGLLFFAHTLAVALPRFATPTPTLALPVSTGQPARAA